MFYIGLKQKMSQYNKLTWPQIAGNPISEDLNLKNFRTYAHRGFKNSYICASYSGLVQDVRKSFPTKVYLWSLLVIFFNFQVCWFKSCSFITVMGSGSIIILYSSVVALLNRRRSEHFDAEITILTIILILGVFEAVTAVIVFRISYPSNLLRQVKRKRICKSTFKTV